MKVCLIFQKRKGAACGSLAGRHVCRPYKNLVAYNAALEKFERVQRAPTQPGPIQCGTRKI
jgi:hypothetical protein